MTTHRYAILTATLLGLFAGSASAQEVIFNKVTVLDKFNGDRKAGAVLVPDGWKVQGGIQWYLNHAHQACGEFRVANPKGFEQVEFLPYKPYMWASRWVVPFEAGSNYMGSEVQKPVTHPRDYVTQFVLPANRRGAKVVDYKELPEIAKAIGGGNQVAGYSVRAGKTRIEYKVGNQIVEEDIYTAIGCSEATISGTTFYNWGPDRVFGVRAAKGELDQKANLLISVANSVTINQEWFGEYLYTVELFRVRMQKGIEAAAALSKTITANSEAMRKMISDSYWERQKVQDHVNTQFSDYIRGVSRYKSPHHSAPIQVPSGYSNVWTNAAGQVILSNNANFDPSTVHGGSWSKLQQAK